jgi:hypothetical protein
MGERQEGNSFMADMLARVVELAVESDAGNKYVAYTVGVVLDTLAAVEEDDPAFDLATNLLIDMAKTITYVRMVKAPTDEDIDAEAQRFRQFLDQADVLGETKNEEDTSNGNSND